MLYSPRVAGIDFYGDNLFTTESQLKLKPEMVKAFREASLKGWKYAMQHPEELVQLIYSRYSQRHSIEHLRFEAHQMAPLLQMELLQIGHMNPGRWQHIAETYTKLGMMKPDFNFKGFLYDPNPPPPDLRWLYVLMGLVTLVIAVVSAIAVYIYRTNARLRQEVADRKQAEMALRESERKYRELVENANSIILRWSRDGKITFMNEFGQKFFGYTETEILGHHVVGTIVPETESTGRDLRPLMDKICANPKDFEQNINENMRRNGDRVWISWTNKTVLDRQGQVMEVFSIGSDITDRKRAEEALQESEERNKVILRTVLSGVIMVDAITRKIVEANDTALKLIGLPGEQVIGFVCHKFICPAEENSCPILDIGKMVDSSERVLLTADGKRKNIIKTVVPVELRGRKYLIESFVDITERKRAEEEKEKIEAQNRQLQKAESLGRMAGAIAHHFNNQLGVVIGNLEMAMDDLPTGAGLIENLTTAMEASSRAAEMSGLMLTYLGQTSGKRELLDISEACLRSLTILRAVMPGKVVLDTDLPSPVPVISANANQIQQVLTNLITNAWEAVGEDGGSIHLGVKTVTTADIPAAHRHPLDWQPQENSYACLEVADEGCGIADKDIEKLFDPFFTSKFTGRGMGLAVVLGIVRAHGGAVTVESKPGRGSIFRVFLPAYAEEVLRQPDKAIQPLAIEGGGKVLLVEDEEMLRNMAAAMLKRLGFSVLEAKDGVEAVEVFRQRQDEIRCVLCDLTMPHMNGWETLTALRKLAPDVPVILTSGYDKTHVMAGDHPEPPQAFLGKPYKLKGLSDAISQALVSKMCDPDRY